MPAPSLADRKTEFELCSKMLNGEISERILLIEAPSKQGKSTLLAALAVASRQLGAKHCAVIELKNCPPIRDVCRQIAQEMGRKACPLYSEALAKPDAPVTVHASLAKARIGDRSEVMVQPVIHGSGAERVAEALLADLGDLNLPTLLIFDTYEKAGHDLQQWMTGQLLPAVRRQSLLFAVVAGIEVPDVKDLGWGACARHHQLNVIESADDWHSYAVARFPGIERSHLEVVLEGLSDPESIYNWIENKGRALRQPAH